MFDWVGRQVLRIVRVPAQPEPPTGAPGSVRVFRAGRNFYNLRLLRWGFTQVGAAAGIAFSLVFLEYLEGDVNAMRAARAKAPPQQVATAVAPAKPAGSGSEVRAASVKPATKAPRGKAQRDGRRALVQTLERWPSWIFPLLHFIEYGAMLLFVVQIPFSFAAVRLEFEQHWYIVTDRSLRIRTGLLSLQESTMSFANLQQVEIKQGPLQRLLGLADVNVQSAGGGGDHAKQGMGDSLHTGIFHGVEHAQEIRDLILDRLRKFRETGLGDPDDPGTESQIATAPAPATGDALTAARELLTEVRALRQAVA